MIDPYHDHAPRAYPHIRRGQAQGQSLLRDLTLSIIGGSLFDCKPVAPNEFVTVECATNFPDPSGTYFIVKLNGIELADYYLTFNKFIDDDWQLEYLDYLKAEFANKRKDENPNPEDFTFNVKYKTGIFVKIIVNYQPGTLLGTGVSQRGLNIFTQIEKYTVELVAGSSNGITLDYSKIKKSPPKCKTCSFDNARRALNGDNFIPAAINHKSGDLACPASPTCSTCTAANKQLRKAYDENLEQGDVKLWDVDHKSGDLACSAPRNITSNGPAAYFNNKPALLVDLVTIVKSNGRNKYDDIMRTVGMKINRTTKKAVCAFARRQAYPGKNWKTIPKKEKQSGPKPKNAPVQKTTKKVNQQSGYNTRKAPVKKTIFKIQTQT